MTAACRRPDLLGEGNPDGVETWSRSAALNEGKKQADITGTDGKVAALERESGLARAQCASRPEILEERSQ